MDIVQSNRKVFTLFSTFFVPAVMAGTMGSATPVMEDHWVAALTGAAVWASAGKTQTFYLSPDIEKTWFANKSSKAAPQGELFLGIQRGFSEKISLQFGLALLAAGNIKLSGEIWDDADPQFNNYTYRYKISHSHLAGKAKLLFNNNSLFTPWLSASLGLGFNRAAHFNNTPTIFEAIMNPDFQAHTSTAFTYNLGAGIQKNLNNNLQMGLGYEFADWGKSRLNRAPGQTLNSGLALNHLYTNGVVLSLTYRV